MAAEKRSEAKPVAESITLSDNAKAVIARQVQIEHYHEAEPHPTPSLHEPFASIPPEPPAFLRRDDLVDQLVSRLLVENMDVGLFALWGRGGVGKTCIAQAVSLDRRVQERFPDGIVWQRVGRNPPPIEERIVEIAEKLNVRDSFTKFDAGAYRSLMSSRRVFLVLDDVWDFRHAQPLLLGAGPKNSSRVMITSRKPEIFNRPDIAGFPVDILDGPTARVFLAQRSGRDPGGADLPEPSATKILKACSGYILAIAMVGGALHGKGRTAWERMARRLAGRRESLLNHPLPPEYMEAQGESGQAALFSCIAVGMEELPVALQERYRSLAFLPETWIADRKLLRCLWGTEPDETDDIVERLVGASLASGSAEDGIALHDFQWEYVCALVGNAEALRLIHRAMVRSAHVIRRDGAQFSGQMIGRLMSFRDAPDVMGFVDRLRRNASSPHLMPKWSSLEWLGACLRVIEGHGNPVSSCAWSPGGDRIVSGSGDSTLRIWDAVTGECGQTLKGHSKPVSSCAWSPSGDRIVSGSADNTLRIWDAVSGECRQTLKGHNKSVSSCAWSPGGDRIVSGSHDDTIRIWDAVSGECRQILRHSAAVNSCAWSPDGDYIVSGSSDNTLRIWDATTGLCRIVRERRKWVFCAWSPGGDRIVSGSADNTLRIWDAVSGECRQTLKGHSNSVSSCAWSPGGDRIVSGSEDDTLRVWDTATGECRRTLKGHTSTVRSCAWSPSGDRIVSGSQDKTLRIWEAGAREPRQTTQGHSKWVSSNAWSPSGDQIVSGSWDDTLRIWDAATGECRQTLKGHSNSVSSCAWSPDGDRIVSGSWDDTLRIWVAGTGDCRQTLKGHRSQVYCCAWSPGGDQIVSGSLDNSLRIWDVTTGECRQTLRGHGSSVDSCAWLPGGDRIVSCSRDDTIRVWDAATGECRQMLKVRHGSVNPCAWSPGGDRIVSWFNDRTLRIWDAATGEFRQILNGHIDRVSCCAWSPNGDHIVSCSCEALHIWDAVTRECVASFTCDAVLRSCSWGRNGIVAGDEKGNLYVFDWTE